MSSIADSSDSTLNQTAMSYSTRLQKTLWSSLLIVILAVIWIVGTQLTQETYVSNQFQAPFLVMYIWSAVLILFYPVYVAVKYAYMKGQCKPTQEFRGHLRLFLVEGEIRIGKYIGVTVMFCVFWTVSHYTYIRALDPNFLAATDVVTLYSTHHSFVYLLSWIILFDKFIALRIIAVIFSISGIVLFAYADGFGTPSMWGVILAVAASSTMSVFKVLLKKFLGTPGYGKTSLFISLIGCVNILCLWPILLVLCLTKAEVVVPNLIPVGYLLGSAASVAVLHVLLTYTHHVAYSIFTGLGFLLGMIVCAVADFVWRHYIIDGMKIAAVIMISLGVLLVLLPDHCPATDCGLFTKCQKWKRREVNVNGNAQTTKDFPRSRQRRSTKI